MELKWGIRFSTTMQAESGRPYNPQQGIDVPGQGEPGSTWRHAIVPKNDPHNYSVYKNSSAGDLQACLAAGTCVPTGFDSARGTPFFQWDIRAGKQINFGERAKLELFFQGFDLTNRANFGGNYNNNIRSASFAQPTGFITPSGTVVPRSFSGEFGAQFHF